MDTQTYFRAKRAEEKADKALQTISELEERIKRLESVANRSIPSNSRSSITSLAQSYKDKGDH